MEKTISFHSDGKLVKIYNKGETVEILQGKTSEIIPVSRIVNIAISRRKNRFKPDLFFIIYAIISTAISIGIVKILFKSIPTLNIAVVIFIIVTISIILQINTANKKLALFIETDTKTIEIPVDETAKIESIRNVLNK